MIGARAPRKLGHFLALKQTMVSPREKAKAKGSRQATMDESGEQVGTKPDREPHGGPVTSVLVYYISLHPGRVMDYLFYHIEAANSNYFL